MPHSKAPRVAWRTRHAITLCCLSSLLGASPATLLAQDAPPTQRTLQQNDADEADVEFELGNAAYKRGDYNNALAHYFASNRLAPNRNVVFNIARCYENTGRNVEAYRYYKSYAVTATDNSDRARAQESIDRIKDRVALLNLTTSPPGATIYLNRRELGSYGTTPQELAIEPGSYTVILEYPGYEPATVNLNTRRGERESRQIKLRAKLGKIAISGPVALIELRVDDQEQTQRITLPAELDLPIGEHTLTVNAPGYAEERVTVVIKEDRTAPLTLNPARHTAALVVQSTEDNAAILLNRKLVGFTPAVIENLPIGSYELTLVKDGFAKNSQRVKLTAQQRLEVSVELEVASAIAAASRVVEDVSEAPASVSVVSSNEIDAFNYLGTADLLRGTRGIYMTNEFSYTTAGVRGYSPYGQFGNRLQVQIDGHTINENWSDASFSEFELLTDLNSLERVEVVRGPVSVLYGSGAFVGVVNVVTPDGDSYRSSRVGMTGMSDGTARAYANARHRFEDGSGGASLSVGGITSQGRPFSSPAARDAGDPAGGEANAVGGFNAYTMLGKIDWKGLRLSTYFHGRDKDFNIGSFNTRFADPRARQEERRSYVDVRYERELSPLLTLTARLYGDLHLFNATFPYSASTTDIYQEEYMGVWGGAEVIAALSPFTGATWTVGLGGQRHFMTRSEGSSQEEGQIFATDFPYTRSSAYLIARQDFGRVASLSLGGRYDLWSFDALPSNDGTDTAPRLIQNINPRAVLAIKPGAKNTFKLMGGRGFRAPSVYELTYNDNNVTQQPSPDLTPETIVSGEVEYTRTITSRVDVLGAVYVNRLGERIEQNGAGVAGDLLRYENAEDELWTGGAELELRRKLATGWMASAQYSYQRTRQGMFEDVFADQSLITNSPAHLASVKLIAPIIPRTLQLATRAILEAPRLDSLGELTDPALLLDVNLSGEANRLGLHYNLGVRNLLDWRYEHPVGDDIPDVRLLQPGRVMSFDLSKRF